MSKGSTPRPLSVGANEFARKWSETFARHDHDERRGAHPTRCVIGIGHKARSGKDTLADYLVRRHGFKKIAFADPLKTACAAIFGFSDDQLRGAAKEAPDPYWSSTLRAQTTPRQIMQRVGTDLFRAHLHPDIWIAATIRAIAAMDDCDRLVISDVRFPNEALAIQATLNGVVARVDRPCACADAPPRTRDHSSENAMIDFGAWDYVINNGGSVQDLYAQGNELVKFAIDRAMRAPTRGQPPVVVA